MAWAFPSPVCPNWFELLDVLESSEKNPDRHTQIPEGRQQQSEGRAVFAHSLTLLSTWQFKV
jgi:hypothetical protein